MSPIPLLRENGKWKLLFGTDDNSQFYNSTQSPGIDPLKLGNLNKRRLVLENITEYTAQQFSGDTSWKPCKEGTRDEC